jgi:hypothetical protein
LTKYQLNAVKMLHQQLRRDAALQALANRKCLNRRNQVSSGVNISELKSDSDLARQNHQAALRWRSSNSLSSHSQGSSEQDTISSDGASYEAAGDGSYLKRVGGQEKGLNNAKMASLQASVAKSLLFSTFKIMYLQFHLLILLEAVSTSV